MLRFIINPSPKKKLQILFTWMDWRSGQIIEKKYYSLLAIGYSPPQTFSRMEQGGGGSPPLLAVQYMDTGGRWKCGIVQLQILEEGLTSAGTESRTSSGRSDMAEETNTDLWRGAVTSYKVKKALKIVGEERSRKPSKGIRGRIGNKAGDKTKPASSRRTNQSFERPGLFAIARA